MKGYKGTDKNMICRDMQYEVGETYRVNGAVKLCENGNIPREIEYTKWGSVE